MELCYKNINYGLDSVKQSEVFSQKRREEMGIATCRDCHHGTLCCQSRHVALENLPLVILKRNT